MLGVAGVPLGRLLEHLNLLLGGTDVLVEERELRTVSSAGPSARTSSHSSIPWSSMPMRLSVIPLSTRAICSVGYFLSRSPMSFSAALFCPVSTHSWMGSSLRCSEMVSGGAAADLVLLPIVPRRIQTSGRRVFCREGPRPPPKSATLGPSQTRLRRHARPEQPGHTPILRSGERDHHELAVLRRRPPYRDRSRGPGSNLRRRRRHLGRLRRVQRVSPRVLSRAVPSLFLVVEPREPRSHPRSPLPRPTQVSPEGGAEDRRWL